MLPFAFGSFGSFTTITYPSRLRLGGRTWNVVTAIVPRRVRNGMASGPEPACQALRREYPLPGLGRRALRCASNPEFTLPCLPCVFAVVLRPLADRSASDTYWLVRSSVGWTPPGLGSALRRADPLACGKYSSVQSSGYSIPPGLAPRWDHWPERCRLNATLLGQDTAVAVGFRAVPGGRLVSSRCRFILGNRSRWGLFPVRAIALRTLYRSGSRGGQ